MPHCKLKNCPFDRDGKCVENQLPNCPNLVIDDAVAEQQVPEEISAPTHESFYSGDKLTADEAAPILQANPFVVVLGGMVEAGKTTLLARIFEMFQCGTVVGFRYMTSRTPLAFDKLSWHATMECGANSPTTEHTYRSENNLFLHLRIRGEKSGLPPVDLLLGDIPGEIFPEAVAEDSVCRGLQALRRADHIALFLDCGVLRDLAQRHDHAGKVIDFVLRALQTGQIGQHTVLHLIISKCDFLLHGESKSTLQFVENTERSFRARFAHRVGGLHVWRLAPRPELPFEPTFAKIDEMFHVWTTRATPHAGAFMQTPHRAAQHRDFCRFGLTS